MNKIIPATKLSFNRLFSPFYTISLSCRVEIYHIHETLRCTVSVYGKLPFFAAKATTGRLPEETAIG